MVLLVVGRFALGAGSSAKRGGVAEVGSRHRLDPEQALACMVHLQRRVVQAEALTEHRLHLAAGAVPMNANRSASTCWKLPSRLRLRRSAPASTRLAARFTAIPARAIPSTRPARTWGGSNRRRTAS